MSWIKPITKLVSQAYKYVRYGKQVNKTAAKISKPANSVMERKVENTLVRTTTKYGENGSMLKKVETIYNPTNKDVYISALNYKMPNGQIVNGSFKRSIYYSLLDQKVVNQNSNMYGRRNSFISFFEDAQGQFHTTQKTHSGIAWGGSDRVKSNQYK